MEETHFNCWVKIFKRHPSIWVKFFTVYITWFKFNATSEKNFKFSWQI